MTERGGSVVLLVIHPTGECVSLSGVRAQTRTRGIFFFLLCEAQKNLNWCLVYYVDAGVCVDVHVSVCVPAAAVCYCWFFAGFCFVFGVRWTAVPCSASMFRYIRCLSGLERCQGTKRNETKRKESKRNSTTRNEMNHPRRNKYMGW